MDASNGPGGDERPGLAILLNGLTPYNVHLCARLGREMTDVRVHSVFTTSGSDWQEIDLPPEANAARFGHAETDRQEDWSTVRLSDIGRARRIFEHLRRHRVDAVVHCGYASLLHLRLIALCRAAGMSVFLRGDSNIKGEGRRRFPMSWLKKRLLGWAIRRCQGVMPMGEYGRQYFEKYGADLSRSYLVPFEPQYEKFTNVDRALVDPFGAEHDLSADRRRMLYCGRLVDVKRVDLLIDAFSSIAERRPPWDLVIAGDGPLRADLEARVPAALKDRVRWLGFCEVEQLRLAYHLCDVLVLPSEYEPWAVVINEACAAGLVVVASDVVGAARQLVRDRESGRIFRSGDVADLTDALLDVTDDATWGQYQGRVAGVLADWRRDADPVDGVRAALRAVGVLEEPRMNTDGHG
ncbi:MAG: hypothetical protein CMJ18_18285 [Phycisphaeraceae bacterium]|nr:hypothetical protein [Phycisphaeraceae bacterium]